MPKHDAAKSSLKDMRNHIEGLKSFLRTDRCRSWIRQDIRSQIQDSVDSLKRRMDTFEQSFLEERDGN